MLHAGGAATEKALSSESFVHTHTYTHTHPFNGALSGTTQASRYQKGKTNLDFTEARDSEWKWHQLGHMLCMSAHHSRQITTPAPTTLFFTGWMPFQLPNQEWDPPELFVAFQKPITMQAQQSHCPHGFGSLPWVTTWHRMEITEAKHLSNC